MSILNNINKLNKNIKILIYSTAGLLVLGAVTALLLLFPVKTEEDVSDETDTDETNVGNLVFTDKTAEDTETIKIVNANGSYTITTLASKSETGTPEYKIDELSGMNAPLDITAINKVVGNISALTVQQLVEEDAEDLEKYGLSESAATAEIKFNDDTEVAFRVGVDAPTGSFKYICMTGSNDVYIAAAYKVEGLLNTQYSYINTVLMGEYNFDTSPSILNITVKKPGEDDTVIEAIPLARENEAVRGVNTHRFTQPVQADLDITLGERIVYGMYGLTATNAVWAGKDVTSYEAAGLTEPSCIVEMQAGGKNYTLTLGLPYYTDTENEDGSVVRKLEGYYGVFSEYSDVVFMFPQSALPWLDIDYEDVMASLFLLPYIYSLTDVIVETQNDTLHFTTEKDESEGATDTDYFYYLDGNKLDSTEESRFRTLYQFIISVKAESIYNEPATLPMIARFTYRYSDTSIPDDIVEIYESDDRRIIIYFNGIPMYKCRAMYATRLLQNIEAFLNGGELNNSW